VVFDIWVRDVDGVGCEESYWVNLEEGGHFRDFEVCVECVGKKSIAGI